MEPAEAIRILIVDDDPELAVMLKRLLYRKLTAEADVARDCASARERLASGTYDVVTLDFQLPDCDGLELLTEIRAMENPPPVIVVTGHGDEQTAVDSFKLGACGYVVKDKRLTTLLPDAVEHAISEVSLQRAEDALGESLRRFQDIAENTMEWIWEVDSEGKYTYASPVVEKILGYRPEEVIGKHFYDFFHPQDREKLKNAAFEVFERKEPFVELVNLNVDRDGKDVWLSTSGVPVLGESGELLGYRGADVNITDRKRAEETLERYRFLVESAYDAMFFKDLESRYLIVNEKALDAFGAPREDVIGRNDFEIVPDEEEARKNVEDDQYVFDSGKRKEITKHVTLRTGEDYWFHSVKVPAFDDEGRVIGLIGVARDITEKKKMEEELKRSEEYFRALIENTQDVVSILNRDGTIRYISSSAEEALGYTPEELTGTSCFSRVDPDRVKEMAGVLAREIDNPGVILLVEYRFQHKDGSWREYESICHNLIDDPAIHGVVLNSRDITDRKRAERLVKAQRDLAVKLSGLSDLQETLNVVLETIQDATVFDCGGVYTLNEETGALDLVYHTGLSREFVEAAGHYDADTPSAGLVREGKTVFSEYEELPVPLDDVRRKEGLNAIGIVPITDKGNVIGCVNISTHATSEIPDESKSFVESLAGQIGQAIRRSGLVSALAESEERHRLLYESAGEAIYTYDRDLVLTGVNRTGCRIIGYQAEELIGEHILKLGILHPEDIERAAASIARLFSGETVVEDQLRFVTKDGEVVVADVVGAALHKDGEINEVINIAHDITDRKRAEEELKRINAELEGYAHTVSHDLKGPLTAINLAAETLRVAIPGLNNGDLESAETIDELAATIEANAEKAHGRINDLLALAESGQVPRQTSRVDLREIVVGVLEERSGEIQEKGVKVEVGDDLGRLNADPTQLTLLFSNLIGNAIEHNNNGNPVLRVSCLGDDGAGGRRYLVRDNGQGISYEKEDSIFLPFVKGESGGTGIGLSIAKKITEVYGGDIKAYNDNGTCFEFVLRDFRPPPQP